MAGPEQFELPLNTHVVAHLLSLPFEARMQARAVDRDWGGWAHEGRAPPPGDRRVWVLMASRGF